MVTSMFSADNLNVDEAWDIASSLLADFSAKHAEIREVRDLVRQRTKPRETLNDKYLITARGAVGFAIVTQMLSYFEPTARNIKVPVKRKIRKEDERTSNMEGWLKASSETANRRANFVEGQAIYNGVETGEMILGAAFDPYLAKRGEFPLEIVAPDPECCAYARSHYGLTNFVWQEMRAVSSLKQELEMLGKRGKKVWVGDLFEDRGATDLLEDTRFFTREHEFRWIEGEHVYTRRHFAGRVPFDVGYFNTVPSDRAEERSRGIISPVLDLLKSYQQLIDLFVTDAEIGQRPLGILFDGQGQFSIVQISPGEDYEGTALTPVPYNPNHQLLQQIAGMINEQLDIAALPRSTYSGPQLSLSGYALDRFREGLLARLSYLKKNPENALAAHLELRLRLVRHFATSEMAKQFSADDPQLYLDSFSALGDRIVRKGQRPEKMWWRITSDDVNEQDTVIVELSPNLPSDEAGKMSRAQAALASGLPFEWVARNILDVENADELLRQREFEMLLATNEMFKNFYSDYLLNKIGADDKELGKALAVWMKQQGLMEQEAQPPPEMLAQQQGAIPPELAFTPEGQGGARPEGQPPMLPAQAEALQQGGQGMPSQGEQSVPPELLQLLAGAGQGAPSQTQGQAIPTQIAPQALEQVIAQLPPELQQLFQVSEIQQMLMQLIQQGLPPEQAIQQLLQMLQQQGPPREMGQGAPQMPLPQGGEDLPPNAAMMAALMGGQG